MPENIAENYFPDLFSLRTVIPLFKCFQWFKIRLFQEKFFWLGNMINFHTTKSEHMVNILLHNSAVWKGSVKIQNQKYFILLGAHEMP